MGVLLGYYILSHLRLPIPLWSIGYNPYFTDEGIVSQCQGPDTWLVSPWGVTWTRSFQWVAHNCFWPQTFLLMNITIVRYISRSRERQWDACFCTHFLHCLNASMPYHLMSLRGHFKKENTGSHLLFLDPLWTH